MQPSCAAPGARASGLILVPETGRLRGTGDRTPQPLTRPRKCRYSGQALSCSRAPTSRQSPPPPPPRPPAPPPRKHRVSVSLFLALSLTLYLIIRRREAEARDPAA